MYTQIVVDSLHGKQSSQCSDLSLRPFGYQSSSCLSWLDFVLQYAIIQMVRPLPRRTFPVSEAPVQVPAATWLRVPLQWAMHAHKCYSRRQVHRHICSRELHGLSMASSGVPSLLHRTERYANQTDYQTFSFTSQREEMGKEGEPWILTLLP